MFSHHLDAHLLGLRLCSDFDLTTVQADKEKKVFYTLRVCRSDAKLIGKRAAAKKKKLAEEAEAAKAKV